jgi:hypothetical protein
MLKKALPALPVLNTGFIKRVESLASEGSALAMSYADLSERMLKFAQKIQALSEQAQELDAGDNGGRHRKHLRQVLMKTLGTESESVVSKWLTIGEQAQVLLPLKDSVPPQRESLYELAKAADANKPIERWIDDEKLTVNSTVREVLKLTKTKKRAKKKTATEKDFNAIVTIGFRNYVDAFAALKTLINSGAECKMIADDGFWEELRSDVSNDEEFKEAKKRLS